MDDWKMQQGNLGPDADDYNDPDMAMYVFSLHLMYSVVKLIIALLETNFSKSLAYICIHLVF